MITRRRLIAGGVAGVAAAFASAWRTVAAGAAATFEVTHSDADWRKKAYIAQLDQARVFKKAIVTKIEPDRTFYPAESYHQDFLTRNPRSPYIAVNDLPKIEDLKHVFTELYRPVPVLVAGVHSSQ